VAGRREERRAPLYLGKRPPRIGRADRRRAARSVDENQPVQVARPGATAEVPGRVGGGDPSAERVAAEHDMAAAGARRSHHASDVLDGDAHAPAPRERDLVVSRGLIVAPDRRVGDPTEVIVEQLPFSHDARPRPVENGVVLEQVLAAVDRPHLPAVERRDEVLGDRREVSGACRGSGQQHEHMSCRGRPDAQHAHAVVARWARSRSRRSRAFSLPTASAAGSSRRRP
jgi:hypothetical protein